MHGDVPFMRTVAAFLAFSCLVLAAPTALAQAFPSKPVRVIVPAPPGSAPDFLSRLLAPKLGDTWGQPFVIDNVLGAGGNIGTDRVAKAPADGYTLLFNTIGPIGVNISMYANLPFDPVKDFAPITLIAKVPNILVVHPSVPARSVQELIAYAKQNPGKLRYGSPGSGTSNHLSAELLKLMAGIDLLHIPYKSSAQMTIDILGAQVEVVFHNAPVLLPHVKSGALRGLAITSSRRNPSAPELATVAEAGVPGFEVTAWFGLMAPANTPPAVVNKIHADVVKAMALPEVRERMLAQAAEPVGSTPREYATFIAAEIAKWAKVVKQSGAKVE
ncbi:MAG: tripartite tricarboxylate transporter substrate binding protein [Betaproteobacteria bacterium]|nr:tripartite tricarboxylate transporter substrate binding protein [Betaproteobacteria bacterium]